MFLGQKILTHLAQIYCYWVSGSVSEPMSPVFFTLVSQWYLSKCHLRDVLYSLTNWADRVLLQHPTIEYLEKLQAKTSFIFFFILFPPHHHLSSYTLFHFLLPLSLCNYQTVVLAKASFKWIVQKREETKEKHTLSNNRDNWDKSKWPWMHLNWMDLNDWDLIWDLNGDLSL